MAASARRVSPRRYWARRPRRQRPRPRARTYTGVRNHRMGGAHTETHMRIALTGRRMGRMDRPHRERHTGARARGYAYVAWSAHNGNAHAIPRARTARERVGPTQRPRGTRRGATRRRRRRRCRRRRRQHHARRRRCRRCRRCRGQHHAHRRRCCSWRGSSGVAPTSAARPAIRRPLETWPRPASSFHQSRDARATKTCLQAVTTVTFISSEHTPQEATLSRKAYQQRSLSARPMNARECARGSSVQAH